MYHSTTRLFFTLASSALLLAACGEADTPAKASTCQVTQLDGSVQIACPGSDTVTINQGKDGEDGAKGEDGTDAVNIALRTDEASTQQCAFGGKVVLSGPDANANGELEASEEEQSFVVCQGKPGDGKTALVRSEEAPVDKCPTGGKLIKVGLDDDQSGLLEEAEIDDQFTLCNGPQGERGEPGKRSLIRVDLGAATSCPGGNVLAVGVDDDEDGALISSEVDTSVDVCNGADGSSCSVTDNMDGTKTVSCTDGTRVTLNDGQRGADGKTSLVKVSPELPGANCDRGGNKIETGIDDNDNGTLEAAEVNASQTTYVCGNSVPVSASATLSKVVTGDNHTCALFSDGLVQCWGLNSSGQLGDGTDSSRALPTTVLGVSGVTDIETNDDAVCALVAGGQIQCWGNNSAGQLGNGGTGFRQTLPSFVEGITGATKIYMGPRHTCAKIGTSSFRCWGDNTYGQLGNGLTATNSPSPVTLSVVSGIRNLSMGYRHTCAALTSGQVRCWGYNNYGQLGNNTTTNSTSAVTVSGVSGAQSVALGYYHSCSRTSGGAVRCWGRNNYGQLGIGTTTNSLVSSPVSGLSGVTSIVMGQYHSCAQTSSGPRCWGYNNFGQLGNNTTTNSSFPLSIAGVQGSATLDLGFRTSCALSTSNELKCWGYNYYGQLGDRSNITRTVPTSATVF